VVLGTAPAHTRLAQGITSSAAEVGPLSVSRLLASAVAAPPSAVRFSETSCMVTTPGPPASDVGAEPGVPELPVRATAEAGPSPLTLTEVALPVEPEIADTGVVAALVLVWPAGPAPGIATAEAGPPTETASATVQRHASAVFAPPTL
jgi:hypothetical protein